MTTLINDGPVQHQSSVNLQVQVHLHLYKCVSIVYKTAAGKNFVEQAQENEQAFAERYQIAMSHRVIQ